MVVIIISMSIDVRVKCCRQIFVEWPWTRLFSYQRPNACLLPHCTLGASLLHFFFVLLTCMAWCAILWRITRFPSFRRFESKVQISKLLNDLRRGGLIKVDFASKAPRPYVAVDEAIGSGNDDERKAEKDDAASVAKWSVEIEQHGDGFLVVESLKVVRLAQRPYCLPFFFPESRVQSIKIHKELRCGMLH